MNLTPIVKSFPFGDQEVRLETGAIARQASGAVMVYIGGTAVLATVVGVKEEVPGRDFFPLTVNYQEKTYAAGKIPGGYFKREGRPTEKETLTSRLIDRPLRPLFPKGFLNEVQVITTVMSVDGKNDPDIAALIGASAALAVSGIPFGGPIGAARVGYKEGKYILNPSFETLETSELNMVVAGTESAVLMVESEATGLPEDIMLGAVMHAHNAMQTAITAINELKAEAGKPQWDWQAPEANEQLVQQVEALVGQDIANAYRVVDKMERQTNLEIIRANVLEKLVGDSDEAQYSQDDVRKVLASIEKTSVRSRVLAGEPRIDGRDQKTVRPINIQVGVLPKTHGSAIFTRGETQAIVVATVGTGRDAQIIDALEGESKSNFMLHYNFPPYSVGEAGFMSGPKRREIGHGRLARRAIEAVLPSQEEFNYVIRIVSEITESNGSSSMASVCGTSLSLMDAGIPIKAPVAGIAMGLVKEGENFTVLTDILGDEDHLGDMDFKVAGTKDGITALQMDIKIDGITQEIMNMALNQARDGRLHILQEMNQVISESRNELSENAPRIYTMQIKPDKIRDVIGKGGATIRSIIEETGASIDIDDSGLVKVAAVDSESAHAAMDRIDFYTADVEVGQIYEGSVSKIADFGAFVTVLPGKSGLVHISQIAEERVENVRDYLSEGQEVTVKVLEIDKMGRIRLSMKEVTAEEKTQFQSQSEES